MLFLGIGVVGVVHRDVSARNILLFVVKNGYEPKITDFGMSKFAVTEESSNKGEDSLLKW